MPKYNEKLIDDFISEMDKTIREIQNSREWAIENDRLDIQIQCENDYENASQIKDDFEKEIEKYGNKMSVYDKYREKWNGADLDLYVYNDVVEENEDEEGY